MADKLKILIIGSGGREHAVGWKVAQSPKAGQIFFAPGNAGTAEIGTNVQTMATDIPALIQFAKKEKIDLTLALPDDPLALGIVNGFEEAGLRIWGPTQAASEIEWSKAYAKDFMKRHNIPTAEYKAFMDYQSALSYVKDREYPQVIKASGLALGKGVTIVNNYEEAEETIKGIFLDKIFGDAGNIVVIEEYLVGIEFSVHAFSDGKSWKLFPASQDHKRISEGNRGQNTGGMGTISPVPAITPSVMELIEKKIIAPVIENMAKEGKPFVGCLYPGVMLTKEGPVVFEFNARLGDPETQTYMRLLETDLVDIIEASIAGKLGELDIKWKDAAACTVVVASGGYPGKYEKGKAISGIEESEKNKDVKVFQAGTVEREGKLWTNGGRVLGVSAEGANVKEALGKAYEGISKIKFDGMQYRKDIGEEALK